MRTARLSTIFAIVFVDLLGFSLILPLVPFYAKVYNASDSLIGLLVASYAAAQLIGAPILGRLSDRYGRRPVLLISILGTIVGFIILGFANSLWMLFASRILDGATGGNISVAQAYITDITDRKNRAKGLGLIGAAFGLGFIIGPAVGGLLSTLGETINIGIFGTAIVWQFALPAFAAAAVALVNLIAVFFFLPESLTLEKREELAHKPQTEFTFQNLRAAFQRPQVGPLLSTRFVFSLAFSTFQTVFPLWALNRLQLQADETAYILAYVGILVALVQGVAIGRLTQRFDENRLMFSAVILMTLSLGAWAFTPNVIVLLIVLAPLALAGGVLNTVLNSVLTKVVKPEEVGGTLGIAAALESLSRVISPTAGGVLLETLGPWAPGMAGAVLTAWLSNYVYRRIIRSPKPQSTLIPVESTGNPVDEFKDWG
jgi:DHA1 family tetracycline resistance protein-like MFS transporter